ncbi:MAG: hypothetical protein SGARI_000843, partial [Bacillariaceae sp.]
NLLKGVLDAFPYDDKAKQPLFLRRYYHAHGSPWDKIDAIHIFSNNLDRIDYHSHLHRSFLFTTMQVDAFNAIVDENGWDHNLKFDITELEEFRLHGPECLAFLTHPLVMDTPSIYISNFRDLFKPEAADIKAVVKEDAARMQEVSQSLDLAYIAVEKERRVQQLTQANADKDRTIVRLRRRLRQRDTTIERRNREIAEQAETIRDHKAFAFKILTGRDLQDSDSSQDEEEIESEDEE